MTGITLPGTAETVLRLARLMPTPNAYQTWSELKGVLDLDLEMCGSAFLWVVRGSSGPTHVCRVPPHQIATIYSRREGVPDTPPALIGYRVLDRSGPLVELKPDEVAAFRREGGE